LAFVLVALGFFSAASGSTSALGASAVSSSPALALALVALGFFSAASALGASVFSSLAALALALALGFF